MSRQPIKSLVFLTPLQILNSLTLIGQFSLIVSETTVEIKESVRGKDVYIVQTGTKWEFSLREIAQIDIWTSQTLVISYRIAMILLFSLFFLNRPRPYEIDIFENYLS